MSLRFTLTLRWTYTDGRPATRTAHVPYNDDLDALESALVTAAVSLGVGAASAQDVAARAVCDGLCSRRVPWANWPAGMDQPPHRYPELQIGRPAFSEVRS